MFATDTEFDPELELEPAAIAELVQILRSNQSMLRGIIAAVPAVLISGFFYLATVHLLRFDFVYLTVLVGFFVAHGVRVYGRGIDLEFGYASGAIAFVGAALIQFSGLIYAQMIYFNLGFTEFVQSRDMFDFFLKSLTLTDLVVIGLTAFIGYQFAFFRVRESEVEILLESYRQTQFSD